MPTADRSEREPVRRMPTLESWQSLTEAAFQRQIQDFAAFCGFNLIYHTRYSLGSPSGYPDLTLVSESKQRVLFIEVKGPKGVVSPAQRVWIDGLRNAGQEAYVFKPQDWPQVERVLRSQVPVDPADDGLSGPQEGE